MDSIKIERGRLTCTVKQYKYVVSVDGLSHTILVEQKCDGVFDFFRVGDNNQRAIDWDIWEKVMEMVKSDILK